MSNRGDDPARLGWFVRLLATGAYLGYAPVAPATAGSFGCAAILWFLMPEIRFGDSAVAIAALVVTVAAFIALAIWVAGRAELALGHDSRHIVIDEFVGFLLAVLFLPKTILVYVLAFILFRVLDVVKPFPARRVEAVGGGAGVVLDDIVAGVYTNVLVWIMLLVRGW